MKLLLINGWCGSGKDALADYMVKLHGYKKLSFAYPLKIMASQKYDIPLSVFNTQSGKSTVIDMLNTGKVTPRMLLVDLAKKLRKEDNEIFVKKTLGKIHLNRHKNIVIPDFRYGVEFDYLREFCTTHEVITSKIIRFDKPPLDIESERQLDNFRPDITIKNDGDLDVLLEKSNKLVDVIEEFF